MKNENVIKNVIEVALLLSDKPLSLEQLYQLLEQGKLQYGHQDIRDALLQLQQDYKGRGIELIEVASGFRVQTKREYTDWLKPLITERPASYSKALLEVLAIIVYRQPITRAEIENIRGVSLSSAIIRTLQGRSWIKVVGHRELPGRPELLATTKKFLDDFNLKTLADLPSLQQQLDSTTDLFSHEPIQT